MHCIELAVRAMTTADAGGADVSPGFLVVRGMAPVRAVLSLLVAAVVLAPSATTWAQTHDPAPPEPPRWFVAGDVGLGSGSHYAQVGTGAGIGGGYRVRSLLWLGAFYRTFGGTGNDGERLAVQTLTAAGEFHPLGNGWFDPYVFAELGGGRFRTGYGWVEPLDWSVWQSGLAAGAGVGLALVIEDVLGIGAQLGTVHRGEASYVLFGPRVDVRFF